MHFPLYLLVRNTTDDHSRSILVYTFIKHSNVSSSMANNIHIPNTHQDCFSGCHSNIKCIPNDVHTTYFKNDRRKSRYGLNTTISKPINSHTSIHINYTINPPLPDFFVVFQDRA